MKTIKLSGLFIASALIAVSFTGCQKDKTTSTSSTGVTSSQAAQVSNADAEDAVADRNDQEVDNTVDGLQANNYQTPTTKAGTPLQISCVGDSANPPSSISLVYTNFQDSTSGETFVKSGTITITQTYGSFVGDITRTYTFTNFTIITDSTKVVINGTRTVNRTSLTASLKLNEIRLHAVDAISANMNYAVINLNSEDTLKFTRIVDRTRTSSLYFVNIGVSLLAIERNFVSNPSMDTITWTGTVTGVDEAGDNYTRTISPTSPLVCNFFKGTPYLSSGEMTLVTTGTNNTSFGFVYAEDLPSHPRMTLVTVTNNNTGKTHSFVRSFGCKFFKWW